MIRLMIKGGLGNQLFEYAFCRWLQEQCHEPIVVDDTLLQESPLLHAVYMLDFFRAGSYIKVEKQALKYAPFGQKALHCWFRYWFAAHGKLISPESQFQSEKFWCGFLNHHGIYLCANGYLPQANHANPDKIVEGYWQSASYFAGIEDAIRKECVVSMPISPKDETFIRNAKNSDSVCIHIRRGDYVNHPIAMVCTSGYYRRAIEEMKQKLDKPIFYVFSDDIPWLKEHPEFLGEGTEICYIEPGHSAPEELRLMYSCQHFIISNSTFSWWAQFICENKNKIVYAPDHWFRDRRRADVYDPNWILLPCS